MTPVRWILFLLLVAAVASAPAGPKPAHKAGEGRVFPEVAGWTFAPPPGDSVYTPDNLWDIIDGGAELFLSYGFVDLRIGEYTNAAGTDVRVELYRHASKENAFGIYSQERNTGYHFIPIGTQGYVEDGALNFLCGTYYVKVSTHKKGKGARDAMEMIGRKVLASLGEKPGWPPQLGYFPPKKKVANGEGYIGENLLGYKFFRSAFTARYRDGSTLFLIEYASPAEARGALAAYQKAASDTAKVQEGKVAEISDLYNGAVYVLVHGRALAGAYGTVARGEACGRLESVKERIQGGR
jgi:hypothetical protein